jgi:hypothetical protein
MKWVFRRGPKKIREIETGRRPMVTAFALFFEFQNRPEKILQRAHPIGN